MSGIELQPPASPLFIPSYSARFGIGASLRMLNQGGAVASAAWPAANRAIYVPIALAAPYRVQRVWWINGATANGNVDCGIYRATDAGGDLLASTGAVAQSGTDVPQYASLALLLGPGEYYLGLSLSSGTGTTHRIAASIPVSRICGMLQQATAHPLPSSITPAVVATAYLPAFGLTSTASGF